jgi:hypothetical protein
VSQLAEIGDGLIRLLAMGTVFAVVFLAPGWVLAARLERQSSPPRRWALAVVLGPPAVGLIAVGVGRVAGIPLDPIVVGICGVLTAIAFPRTARELKTALQELRQRVYRLQPGEDAAGRPLLTLALAVMAIFAVRFYGAETTFLPARGFAAAFEPHGGTAWFAVTGLGLFLIGVQSATHLGWSRVRAHVAGALLAINPATLMLDPTLTAIALPIGLWVMTATLVWDARRRGPS